MTMLDQPITLDSGGHTSPEAGLCYNEAVAYLAGEQHSDHPECVSPVINRFTMTLNDRLGDEDRQRLRPFLLRTLGTAGDGRDEERRRMCTEWLVRESKLPDLLDLAGCMESATAIREMPADLAFEDVQRILRDARGAAWDARCVQRQKLYDRVVEQVKAKTKGRADAAAATAAAAAADTTAAAAAAVAAAAVADAAAADAAAAAADAGAAADAAVAATGGVAADTAVAVAAAAAAVAAAAAADTAVAVAVAVAAASASPTYSDVYGAVYKATKPIYEKSARNALADFTNATSLDSALGLLDRLLPVSPVQLPAVPNAGVLVGVA